MDFQIKRAAEADVPGIMRIMEEAGDNPEHPDWFAADDEAYIRRQLEQEGFVQNIHGRGCFVLGHGSELLKEQLICKIENNLTEAISAARFAGLSDEELHHLLSILMEEKADE